MILTLLSLTISIQYVLPVQPLPYYAYGLDISIAQKYLSGSIVQVSASDDYSFRFIGAGLEYGYRWAVVGLQVGILNRDRNDAGELGLGSSILAGIRIGGDWNFHLTWRLFPGKSRQLSFLGIGLGYNWR